MAVPRPPRRDRLDDFGDVTSAPASPVRVEPAVVMHWALDGDHVVAERLLVIARTIVVRYCRGRVGRRRGSYAQADALARDVLRTILLGLSGVGDQERSFLRFVYGAAAEAVDRGRSRCAGFDGEPDTLARLVSTLPARQRETLVLRVAVGLSRRATAEVLGMSVRRIVHVEQRALIRLRAAGRRPLGEPDKV